MVLRAMCGDVRVLRGGERKMVHEITEKFYGEF